MHPFEVISVGALVLAAGCRPGHRHPVTGASPQQRSPHPELATQPPASRALDRTPIDQPTPTLTIVSSYPVRQFVFVNAEPVGEVAAGETATFDVPAGRHVVICADSSDLQDNPSRVEVIFEEGYGYTYRLDAE